MKSLLSNLGFVLQFSGSLIFLVAITAIFLKEFTESLAFLLTSSLFLIFGFFLNVLCERKEITFRQSLILLFLTFLTLSLIGSIPYIFLNIFEEENIHEEIVNSIFESASDFTTTGFSFLENKKLSNSFKIYRAVCHFVGGVGIVYLLVTFLYSKNVVVSSIFNKLLGFEVNSKIKRNVIEILTFFSIVTLVLTLYMYYINRDFVKSLSIVMIGISTGGLQIYEMSELSIEEKVVVALSMIFGSMSFFIVSKFKKELPIYLIIVFSLSFLLFLNNIGIFDSIFHAISIISTTGFSYIDLSRFPIIFLFFASFSMIIGGMSISTAGGVKIIRILNSFESLIEIIKTYVMEKEIEIEREKVFSLAYLLFYLFFWIFLCSCLLLYSKNLEKSLFDAAATISNSGFSIGLIDESLPLSLKILVIMMMILGRVEIIPFFALFTREQKIKNLK